MNYGLSWEKEHGDDNNGQRERQNESKHARTSCGNDGGRDGTTRKTGYSMFFLYCFIIFTKFFYIATNSDYYDNMSSRIHQRDDTTRRRM